MLSGQTKPADLYRVEIHLHPGKEVFPSLAHAIAYLIEKQPIIYTLDVIEGDFIHNLVTADQAEKAVRDPGHRPFDDPACRYPGGNGFGDNVVYAPFPKGPTS